MECLPMIESRQGEVELVSAVQAVLVQLQEEFQHGRNATPRPDAAVLAARRQLERLARSIQAMTSPQEAQDSSDSVLSALSSLTRLCDHKFVSFNYTDIPVTWRAVFIDTQLLKACCAIKSIWNTSAAQAGCLRLCIRDLDLALIVAGAASISKHRHCHHLIAALQSELLQIDSGDADQPTQHQGCCTPPRKRPKKMRSEPPKRSFITSAQADSDIPEYAFDQAPSFMELADPDSVYRSKPFLVRGYAQGVGWPGVQSDVHDSDHGSWSSLDHLLKAAGPARVVPVEVGADYSREDWGQDVMLWSDFLERCGWEMPAEDGPVLRDEDYLGTAKRRPILYMAQHNLSSQFPALERDFTLPDYVYTSPPPPEDWPDYKPPATSDGVSINLWVGPADTLSPPHYDQFYNCFVQAVGYKEVWVAPPHCCPRNAHTPSDQMSDEDHAHPTSSREPSPVSHTTTKHSITETLMANTACVDVFDPIEIVPDSVRSAAAKAILGPGDLLYMPPGWWHSLRSLTRSFSVSMWF